MAAAHTNGKAAINLPHPQSTGYTKLIGTNSVGNII